MHGEARDFTIFVKQILPDYFVNKTVLDVGAGDINGNNRFLFENGTYEGNDVIEASNVTIVSKTKDLPFEDQSFDTIISTECFEHDPEYADSFRKIYAMLKPNGLFFFTCASTGRPEHGTRRTTPGDSYGTIGNLEDMSDYYKNLTEYDINDITPLNDLFSCWDTYYNARSCDLYVVGIKKDSTITRSPLPKYTNDAVIHTSVNISSVTCASASVSASASTLDTLDTIFSKYDTDKNRSFHNYSRQYQRLFDEIREKPIKYLEIGVYHGDSLHAMRETFKNATLLVGADINPQSKAFENRSNRVFIEIGDATNPEFVSTLTNMYGTFDIILDDGSHMNKDVIRSFELLFPLLNDNGIYVVEDTICYKSPDHINSAYNNHLQYFFNYTRFLNQWRFDSTEGVQDHCVDPYKIIKKTNNVFEYSIDKIEYGCSYIAIHKKLRKHWIK
jgi:SAM-dependent methyltransferase